MDSDDAYRDDNYGAPGDDDRYGDGDDRGGDDDDKGDDTAESDSDKDDNIASVELSQFDKMLADVAGDSLQWLMHRLGPLLATRHIIRPLLDGMYRCFTSQYSNQEAAVLKCLAHFVSTYGDVVVTKLYIPHAESLVSNNFLHFSYCILIF